jgi:hypothetical protein
VRSEAVALVRLTAGVSRELRKGTFNIPLSAGVEQPPTALWRQPLRPARLINFCAAAL